MKKKDDKNENEESRNFSGMWDKDNIVNRISNLFILMLLINMHR